MHKRDKSELFTGKAIDDSRLCRRMHNLAASPPIEFMELSKDLSRIKGNKFKHFRVRFDSVHAFGYKSA